MAQNRRTIGTYVAQNRPVLAGAERRRIVMERIDALLVEARQLDLNLDLDVAVVLALVRERDTELSERPASEEASR